MSTVDKLNKVLETKQAIKEAIESKGQTVGDVFADYPAAIQRIEGGGGSGTFVVPGGMRFSDSKTIEKFPDNWDWSEIEKETDFQYLFTACNSLTQVPKLKISPISTSQMYYGCVNLTEIDTSGWDSSRVTDMSETFYSCQSIENIDLSNFSTANCTNLKGLFAGCHKLKNINWDFNTAKNSNFTNIFSNCQLLNNIPELDASSNTSSTTGTSGPLSYCYGLRNFGGFKGFNKNLYINSAYSLSYESLLNIINGLADGVSKQTLNLHQDLVNQLSDDDIAIAVNKGWTVSPAKSITEPKVVQYLNITPSTTYHITPKTYDFSQYTGAWGTSSSSGLNCKSNLCLFEGDVASSTNLSYMFKGCTKLYYVILNNTQNVTCMDHMFYNCSSLMSVTMIGGIDNLESLTFAFYNVNTNGTFYYDDRYDYSKIIAELPSTWTAVPITV